MCNRAKTNKRSPSSMTPTYFRVVVKLGMSMSIQVVQNLTGQETR